MRIARLAMAVLGACFLGACQTTFPPYDRRAAQRGSFCQSWALVLTDPDKAVMAARAWCKDDEYGCAFLLGVAMRANGEEVPPELAQRIAKGYQLFGDVCRLGEYQPGDEFLFGWAPGDEAQPASVAPR